MDASLQRSIRAFRLTLNNTADRLAAPRKKIVDHRLKLDDYGGRIYRAVMNVLLGCQNQLIWQHEKVVYNSPGRSVDRLKEKLERNVETLTGHCQKIISEERTRLRECAAKLSGLNPTAILSRGYSITRTQPDLDIVRDSAAVSVEQRLEVILARGSINCDVKERFKNGKKIV